MKFIFETWAPFWRRNPELSQALDRVNSLLEKRASGNQMLPLLPTGWSRASVQDIVAALCRYLRDHESVTKTELESAFESSTRFLECDRWARWLYLEHALEVASNSGDLLFSALLLRTMGEEVRRLHILERESTVVEFPSETEATKSRAAGLIAVLEPMLGTHRDALRSTPEIFTLAAYGGRAEQIDIVLRSLNDYVHPNLGSHVVAIFPSNSAAPRLLIDAAESIYAAFLRLPWSNESLKCKGFKLPVPYRHSWNKIGRWIETHVVPEACRLLGKNEGADSVEISNVESWLREKHTEEYFFSDPLLREPWTAVASLLQPGSQLDPGKTVIAVWKQGRFPLKAKDTEFFSRLWTVRALTLELTSRSKDVEDVGSMDWFAQAAIRTNLAAALTNLKLHMFMEQLLRQIANRNPLGAVICMRAVLEHNAVLGWILSKIERHWDKIKKHATSGTLSADALRGMDKNLATFLLGTKGTLEDVAIFAGSGAHASSIPLLDAVDSEFGGKEAFQTLYNFGSAVLHGRLMRGLELVVAPLDKYKAGNLLKCLEVLEFVSAPEHRSSLLAKAGVLGFRLAHVGDVMSGDGTFVGPRDVAQAVVSMARLKERVDYTGDGSREKPFEFRKAIQYFDAFDLMCKQLGINPQERHLDGFHDGFLLEYVEGPERAYWFARRYVATSTGEPV